MLKKIISIVLVISLLCTTTNLLMIKSVYAAGDMTNTSTVVDFEAVQNAANSTVDTDNDGVYDEVEKIIGTDLYIYDTDADGLDDYFELTNGLDPLNPDSNNDGVDDLFEVTKGQNVEPDVALDTDDDKTPNIFDDDNDDDGIVDYIDISPFASMDVAEEKEFVIKTDGDVTFVTIQLRPEDVDEIIKYGRSMTWPEDQLGQIKNMDDSIDNFNIKPYLRINYKDLSSYPSDVGCQEYGYIKRDDDLFVPLEKIEKDGEYIGYQGIIYIPKNGGKSNESFRENTMKVKLSYMMTVKNDYLGQGMHVSAPITGSITQDVLPIEVKDFDELREKQFLNTSVGYLDDDDIPDLAIFYTYYDDVENGIVNITYDVYYDITFNDYYDEGDINYDQFQAGGLTDIGLKFPIDTGFEYINRKVSGEDIYNYLSRFDMQIIDGEICAFYIDGKETASIYKADEDGSVIDTGIRVKNGSREYFYSEKNDKDFIGSNITDSAGYYNEENDTYFYLYSALNEEDYTWDTSYLIIKKPDEEQKKVTVDFKSNSPIYRYSKSDSNFADTEISCALDIFDVNSDGKDDLVMLGYRYGSVKYLDYSRLYFISDIFNCDFDDYKIVKEIEVDIKNNDTFARSMDLCDIDKDGLMDVLIVAAKKEIIPQYEIKDTGLFSMKWYTYYNKMNLTFDMDVSYAINSREEILLTNETPFKITGIQVESQNEIKVNIFAHEYNEIILGVTQSMEYEFINTAQEIDEAINSSIDNLELNDLDINFDEKYYNYDRAIMEIGEFFNYKGKEYENETKAFLLAVQKKLKYFNLDEFETISSEESITFDLRNSPIITNKELSLKWIKEGVLASPENLLNIVDENTDNINFFNECDILAKDELNRLNIGTTRITQIGDDKIKYINDEYEKDSKNPVYLTGKIPASGASGYIFIATHTYAKETTRLINLPGGKSVGGYLFVSPEKAAKAAKYAKYTKMGYAATAIGLVVDIAFSCYNGYLYGQNLESRGANDTIVGGAQVTYTALYSAKAIFLTVCVSGGLGPIGYVIFALAMVDMILDALIDSYDSVADKAIIGIVKALYDYEVYEGTYISTFNMIDKEVTRSNDGQFTWVGDSYLEDTTYKTIISAKDKDSPANRKSKLDNCWIQIYDDFYSEDAIINKDINDNKEWTEDFYKYKDKWRQKRYFYFNNSADFNEVGRNVLIENDVTYKYKVIEKIVRTKEFFDEEITYYYSDSDKVYEYLDRDMYFDILPTSFEVFFETFDLVDGLNAIEKNQLGCRDIDGDGLLVNKDGHEIDSNGDILSSDSDKFDTDNDGLSDYLEAKYDSNPRVADTDGDGLLDFEEFKLSTNLNDADTDGDGVSDYTEVNTPVNLIIYGSIAATGYSSPHFADTDGDFVSDFDERLNGTNPASKFTHGGSLYDNNFFNPQLSTDFDDYYGLTNGEKLEIDLNNHITDADGNDLVFTVDYGDVDENGIFTYIYDKVGDGTSFEVKINVSDSRGGLLETHIIICEDTDAPFLTKVSLDGTDSRSIEEIDTKANSNSVFEVEFNEDIIITTPSAITILPVYNQHLDVGDNYEALSISCNVNASLTTSKAITITRQDNLVENNITYELTILKNALTDTNGNSLQNDYKILFTTIDTIAPKLVSLGKAVGIDDPIIIEFNEPVIQKPTYYFSTGNGSGLRIVDESSQGKTYTGYVSDNIFTADIRPNTLKSYETYILDSNLNKFWDLSNNVFTGFDAISKDEKSFTTSDVEGLECTLNQFNLESPFVRSYNFCYETEIVDGEIRVTFNEPIKEGIDYDSIALSYENNLYFYGCDTAANRVKEEAKKYVLPYTSCIEGNTLIVTPQNYDPSINYSLFIEEKSLTDMYGSHIKYMLGGQYRVRILAKSQGVPSTVKFTETDIVALSCYNVDMSKNCLVSDGLSNFTYYTYNIAVVLNESVTANGPINMYITDSSNNVVTSTIYYFDKNIITLMIDEELEVGQYTINIPAGTFKNINGVFNNEIKFSFNVKDEIDIKIGESDVLGIPKVGEKLYLSNDYLNGAMKQDDSLEFKWYRSDENSFDGANLIVGVDKYEYITTQSDEGKYIFVSVNNENVFEISTPIGAIEQAYKNYCNIDNISVKHNNANIITYDSNINTYNLNFSAEKDKVVVSADYDESKNMDVSINNIKSNIWQEEGQMTIPLEFGDNKITVTSKAENREDTKLYTINVNRDKIEGAENVKPRAESVSIINSDKHYKGETLTGDYLYQDDLSRPEGDTVIKWYRDNDASKSMEILGANSLNYTITEDDIGYALMMTVTPKTDTDVVGEEWLSSFTEIIEAEGITLYNVTFEENGGSPVNDITGVESESTISKPDNPIRYGYVFSGWYRDENLAYEWDFNNDIVTNSITLYAKWVNNQSSVPQPEDSNIIPENLKGNSKYVEITNKEISLKLSGESFADLKNKDVKIALEEIDKEDLNLSEEDLEQIGNLPVYDISVYVDGKKIYFETDKSIEVEIKLNSNNENHKYVAIYVDDNGNIEILKNSFLSNGIIKFTTNHLSNYGVMYIDKTFEDSINHWGIEAIEALASRGIINGTSETTFSPNRSITRADFITLVVRYFDFNSDKIDNFSDVDSNMYYSNPIAIAKNLGLVKGTGNNEFKPLETITRQDMMVILDRALKISGYDETIEETSIFPGDFNDNDEISNYAVESVNYMISVEIINGDNKNINPKANSTRAEIAQMIYNLLKKLNSKVNIK